MDEYGSVYTGSNIWLDVTNSELVIHNTDLSYVIQETLYFVVPSNDALTTAYIKKWIVQFYTIDCSATEIILKDPSEFVGLSW